MLAKASLDGLLAEQLFGIARIAANPRKRCEL
jgi:hypothetical protein